MSTTKDQWAEIEQQLSGFFGRVELLCDGYKINAEVKSIAPMRQGIVVYVNGYVRGEWMKGEAEEARKFHREMKRFLYSAKQREKLKTDAKNRCLTADWRKRFRDMATASVSTWAPYWTNAKAFTRHLRKTCTDISVVKIGY
jgi:hypothetical protein